jgi:flagellin
MVIHHNLSALSTLRYMNMTNSSYQKSLLKLSSGFRINSAADDPAGLAISEKMRAQIAGLSQAVNNANDGMSMIQTYEGALTETHAILSRMKTLATQAANGIYDDGVDRAAIQYEYNQLLDELDDISGTDFNGITALDGGESGLQHADSLMLQLGSRSKDLKNFNFDYSSAWNTLEDPAAARQSALGNLTPDMNTSSNGLGLRDTNLSTQASANAAMDFIDQAINKVSMTRATFGSIQNRLESKVDNLNTTIENISNAESRIRDTDMAKEILELTRLQILMQVQQAVLAQILDNEASFLQLLNSL